MSAKGDEKSLDSYSDGKQNQHNEFPAQSKRNKINTSEKLSKKGDIKTDEKYYESDESRRLSEDKISYYAESKTAEKRQRSSTDPSRNGNSSAPLKHRINNLVSDDSLDEIDEVDREFENLLKKPNEGSIELPSNPLARLIMNGFQINQMNMRDANNGKLLWTSRNWTPEDMLDDVMEARIPKEILECDAVSREINFSSQEKIENFRLVQRIFVHGSCLEEWSFKFGFVIPGSTNSWQQTIYAAPRSKMIPAEVLRSKLFVSYLHFGNTTIETAFYDGDLLIAKTLLRLYYD